MTRGRCGRGGCALGDHVAGFEAVHAVAHRMISGMSCSMMIIERVELASRIVDQQRAERLGLALGDAGGRFVEAQHAGRRARAGRPARRSAGCRSRGRRRTRRRSGRARGSRSARRPPPAGAARARAPAGRTSAVGANDVRPPRLERDLDGLAHGELGEQPRRLEGAAEPGAGPPRWRRRPLTSPPSSSTDPVRGTNPPMAFISVDLPAPLVPISPTISPRARRRGRTSSTAWTPPKRTDDVVVAQRRLPSSGSLRSTACTTRSTGGRRSPPSATARVAAGARSVEHGPADRVADLGEAAREVHHDQQQADARGEQRDQLVVGEQGRQADHPQRAEHRTGQRADAADHDHARRATASRRRGSSARRTACSATSAGQQAAAERRRSRRPWRTPTQLGATPGRSCRPAAASGLSRTAIVERPTPLPRSRATRATITTRTAEAHVVVRALVVEVDPEQRPARNDTEFGLPSLNNGRW